MSTASKAQARVQPVEASGEANTHRGLQAKCACGASADLTGACGDCQKKRHKPQRYPAGRVVTEGLLRALATSDATAGFNHSFGQVRVHKQAPQGLQAKTSENGVDDAMSPSGETQTAETAEAALETATAEGGGAAGLIVEDETRDLGPRQMRKSEFLDALRSAVCAAADAELAAAGRSTEGCPYIEQWIEYYRTQSGSHIERAILRYTPEAAGLTSAQAYPPLIAERIRHAVSLWATTGEITGVPEGVSPEAPGTGPSAPESGPSSTGSVAKKEQDSSDTGSANPQEIQSQLSAGRTLDSRVTSRMSSAFGHDFSAVRVHTDTKAAQLSASLNARAFTIGRDVAFAAGEYQPGSLIGDALIAHELAHVVQQGNGAGASASPQMASAEYNSLEEDADQSAVSAIVSMWGGLKGRLAGVSENAMPSLRSGLRLSRCKKGVNEGANACTAQTTPATPAKSVTVRHSHLFGGKGTGAFTTDLAYANKVYAIAGIGFTAGNQETIDEPNTKDPGLLGSNALLNDSGTNPQISTYTAEEKALMAHNEAAGEVTVYYIKDVENTANLNGRGFLQDDAVIVNSGAPTRTWPHEMGHILIGAGHPSNNDNIMAQSSVATGVDCLSDEQIEAARKSSLAK